jgi:hypothetical protein
MKTTMKTTLAMLALGVSALAVNAQDATANGDQNGPSPRHHRSPPAIIAAIDANHDGVIDADEIANASAVLKTLDKNGDGVLTPDEFIGKPLQRPLKNGGDVDAPLGPPPGDE